MFDWSQLLLTDLSGRCPESVLWDELGVNLAFPGSAHTAALLFFPGMTCGSESTCWCPALKTHLSHPFPSVLFIEVTLNLALLQSLGQHLSRSSSYVVCFVRLSL